MIFLVFISFEYYLNGIIFCVLFEDFHFPLSFYVFIDVVYSYSHFITSIFLTIFLYFKCYQFSSVALSCLTLCDPMDHSTTGFPVHWQLPESTQTHIRWVGDAIQSSHPRSSPSPPTINLFHHQGLFQWLNSSHQVTKVLEFQSFLWTPGLISFRMNWLDLLAVQGTLKSLL